jgi:hypothetical protein
MDVADIEDLAEKVPGALVDDVRIVEGQPVPEVSVRHFDVKAVLFLADEDGRIEPGLEGVRIDLGFDGPEDIVPRILFFFRFHESRHFFHRIFNSCGKPSPGGLVARRSPAIIALRRGHFKHFFRGKR